MGDVKLPVITAFPEIVLDVVELGVVQVIEFQVFGIRDDVHEKV